MDEIKNNGNITEFHAEQKEQVEDQEIEELKEPEDIENFIDIDDGKIEVKIRNQFGEVTGSFRFNPTDVKMVNRYNEAAERLQDIVKPLVNYNIGADGSGDGMDAVKALNEAEDQLIKLFDYVLDGDSRAAFFSHTHAFSPMDGTFYCGKVLDGLGAFISKKFEVETKKADIRLQQRVHGYRTGKHKKGDR